MKSLVCAFFCAILLQPSAASANVVLDDCTDALFIMPGMTGERNGLLLTNGHRLGLGDYEWNGHRFLRPDQVLIDHSFNKEPYTVTVFVKRGEGGKKYSANKVIFGAMTIADLAVIELNAAYNDLQAAGYRIYRLSKQMPNKGTQLDFISYNEKFDSLCIVQEVSLTVVEGPYIWLNVVKMRLNKLCRVYPGVSGTPGIQRGANTIYAVGNTEYTGISDDCAIMNPCERQGEKLQHGARTQTHAIPTAPLYKCYDVASARFDFSLPNCDFGRLHRSR